MSKGVFIESSALILLRSGLPLQQNQRPLTPCPQAPAGQQSRLRQLRMSVKLLAKVHKTVSNLPFKHMLQIAVVKIFQAHLPTTKGNDKKEEKLFQI